MLHLRSAPSDLLRIGLPKLCY